MEWNLLLRATKTDWGGWSDGEQNKYGGFHNDFFDIRPYYEWFGTEEFDVPEPNFEFRPYNLQMNWYKYPWRSAECNRELSIQQVLNVFRLCIEVVRDGRRYFPPAQF